MLSSTRQYSIGEIAEIVRAYARVSEAGAEFHRERQKDASRARDIRLIRWHASAATRDETKAAAFAGLLRYLEEAAEADAHGWHSGAWWREGGEGRQ